jgi:hypothetical protein
MVATKKNSNKKETKIFLVPDNPHGIIYAVTVPEKTTDKEAHNIHNKVLVAANQYYLVLISVRRSSNIDLIKWINKFLELNKLKNILVEEIG